MSMRAQISLQFDDADLYQNFVIPYKEGRVLNSLIIKCLSAYYYNEEVRNLIEGTSIEDATDGESVQSNQSLCDSIRASLMMQDFLASELQNTIDNGTEDIENVLHKTNDFAEKSGVAKPTTSEYGSNILQISVSDKNIKDVQGMSAQDMQSVDKNSAFSILVSAVLKLAEASGNSEVVSMLHSSSNESDDVENKDLQKTESLNVTSEVLNDTNSNTSNFDKTVGSSSNDFETEDVISVKNDFDSDDSFNGSSNTIVEEKVVEEDASDAMKELLDSL